MVVLPKKNIPFGAGHTYTWGYPHWEGGRQVIFTYGEIKIYMET